MRLLVTGAAGFIGSYYVRTLLTGGFPGFQPARVTVLDKLTYAGRLANLAPVETDPRYRFVRGDICDPALLAGLVCGHDVVVNFAAETHVDRAITGVPDFVAANVAGVQTLLEACVRGGVRRVVHISTDEVYGSIESGAWTEDARLDPSSPYAAAKAAGDLMAGAYARTTAWVHAGDHCRGIQLVLERGEPGRAYHIGGDAELTNAALTRAILDECGLSGEMVRPVSDRKGHDRRYALHDSLLRGLGYRPRTPFATGLAATVRWYRETGPGESRSRQPYRGRDPGRGVP